MTDVEEWEMDIPTRIAVVHDPIPTEFPKPVAYRLPESQQILDDWLTVVDLKAPSAIHYARHLHALLTTALTTGEGVEWVEPGNHPYLLMIVEIPDTLTS